MCISIRTLEPDCFSFHQCFEDASGVGGGKCRYWKVLVFLSVCSYLGGWLSPPLKRFRSRNSTRSSLMLHVNFRVLCTLFSLSRKPSSSLLVPTQMHWMSSM